MPAEAILLEEQATNTYENVAFTNRILDGTRLAADPAGQLAVSHAPRPPDVAQGRARRQVVATPPERRSSTRIRRGATLEQIRGLLQEYAAIAYYWWRGRI